MWSFSYVIVLVCLGVTFTSKVDYTISGQVEKNFAMEEELISISGVILNEEKRLQEDDDEPNDILEHFEFLNQMKALHADVVTNDSLSDYLDHPINALHLLHRLAYKWSSIIEDIMEASSCSEPLKKQLQDIQLHLPSKDDVKETAHSFLAFHHIYNFTIDDVMLGNVSGKMPHTPLTLTHATFIAEAAGNAGHLKLAIKWLKYVAKNLNSRPDDFPVKVSGVYNRLSSLYHKIGKTAKALEIAEKLLKIEPSNKIAMANKVYYTEKLKDGSVTRVDSDVNKPSKLKRRFDKKCRRLAEHFRPRANMTGCINLRLKGFEVFGKSRGLKLEIIRKDPFIGIFHDALPERIVNGFESLATKPYLDVHKHEYYLMDYNFNVENRYMIRWTSRINDFLSQIHLSVDTLELNEKISARNTGMAGSLYNFPLRLTTIKEQPDYQNLGHLYIPVSENVKGGEFISMLKPDKYLYKFPFKRGQVIISIEELSVCPVIYGSHRFVFGILKVNGPDPRKCYYKNIFSSSF